MIILEKDKIKLNKFTKINSEKITINDINSNTIINIEDWIKLKNDLEIKNISFGIEFFSDDNFNLLLESLKKLCLIQINFKTFKDGRPFTFVKKLRKEYLFSKEIRATGHILPDQYVFLLRSGFDTVEINKEDKDIWIEMYKLDNTNLYYQPF